MDTYTNRDTQKHTNGNIIYNNKDNICAIHRHRLVVDMHTGTYVDLQMWNVCVRFCVYVYPIVTTGMVNTQASRSYACDDIKYL